MSTLRSGALALGGFAAAFLAYAGGIERSWLVLTRHTVVVAGLPHAWDGLCIAQLSDLHLGSSGAPYRMFQRAVATTVALRPDLIVLTGDYSDDGQPRSFDLLAPLARAAPTLAVLGNHDYFQQSTGANAIAGGLEAQGITVLRNAMTTFIYNGVAGSVAGFDDDRSGPGADVAGIVAQMRGSPRIVLVHEPDVVDRFPPHWAHLALAGHTHGAQVRLSPVRTMDWIRWTRGDKHSRYPRGWFTINGNLLYVNRGLGVAGHPVRFAARPELACFTLVRDEGLPR